MGLGFRPLGLGENSKGVCCTKYHEEPGVHP